MLFSYFHWEDVWLKNFFWKGIRGWTEKFYALILICSDSWEVRIVFYTSKILSPQAAAWLISEVDTWAGGCCLRTTQLPIPWEISLKLTTACKSRDTLSLLSQKKQVTDRAWKNSQKRVEHTTGKHGQLFPMASSLLVHCSSGYMLSAAGLIH